jgi:hypothetical protein
LGTYPTAVMSKASVGSGPESKKPLNLSIEEPLRMRDASGSGGEVVAGRLPKGDKR